MLRKDYFSGSFLHGSGETTQKPDFLRISDPYYGQTQPEQNAFSVHSMSSCTARTIVTELKIK